MIRSKGGIGWSLVGLILAPGSLFITGPLVLIALSVLTLRWCKESPALRAPATWISPAPVLILVWLGVVVTLSACALGAPLVATDSCVRCSHNLRNIGTALDLYASDNAKKYPREMALLVPGYLKEMPRCRPENPSLFAKALFQTTTGIRLTEYDYARSRSADACTVWCTTGAHTWGSVPRFYPQYSSAEGIILGPR